MSMKTVVGQEYAKKRLGKLFTGEPGHAYIFLGPEGIGKRTMAKEVAKGFLCMSPTEDGACGVCPSCRYFESGTHPDFRHLFIPDGEKLIKVDTVRSKIGADVSLFSQISKRKVYLIDGDGLNEQGQNALLKTLEEPPPGVHFLLTGSDVSHFLSTILSRSDVITLQPNTDEEMLFILEKKVGLSEASAMPYVLFSEGIPGRALALSESPWFSELRNESADMFFFLANASVTECLTAVYGFFEENKDHVSDVLSVWQLIVRDLSVLLHGQEKERLMNKDFLEKMRLFLQKRPLTIEDTDRAGMVLSRTFSALRANCSFESTICSMLLSIVNHQG